jgi:hypothetical protein
MENDTAKAGLDLIDSSLQMVRDSSAYIGIISRKYGQTPKCPRRNPDNASITELEFNEAQRLGRPILLFIMGEKHSVTEAEVETNATKRKKLKAFRERAKKMSPDSDVHRVYATFESLEEFKEQAGQAVANLRRYLDEQSAPAAPQSSEPNDRTEPYTIPTPPAFYAEPPYIGSHEFLGRENELITLDEWASAADPYSILLFEAIGGAGKSIITWEWANKWATTVREDWAGRFWYSFYERGADMSDFCRRAMAYVTCRPLSDFRGQRTTRLAKLLVARLKALPWMFILDGLERVLVAYQRFDAAQLADEDAGTTDQIAHRDPCAAIRPEDDDLLRALAAASPSKLIFTSRLTPRVLLNKSSQSIPGVLRVPLSGLRPADAEALLRACGVRGNSREIQHYLKSHCDCHPLVTGVLAGLINDYLPDRGNFDAWAADPAYGGQLNLANLELVQKRNDILHAALAALSEKSRQLLSTLALLPESADYPTLSALNPHLSPEPEEVPEPRKPEESFRWKSMSDDEKEQSRQIYQAAIQPRKAYEQAVKARLHSPEFLKAPQELAKTVRDLERRGLLQYDAQTKRYDLHPVVRGIAAGGMRQEEKKNYGQRAVDYFSRQAHNPYEQAETLEDLRNGLNVVRTLLQMGHYKQACEAFDSDLAPALYFNLEAHAEVLSILRPFFPQGWAILPDSLPEAYGAVLATGAAIALAATGEPKEALTASGAALASYLRQEDWDSVQLKLSNVSEVLSDLNRLANAERCSLMALDIALLTDNKRAIFTTRLRRFTRLVMIGKWEEAEEEWRLLNPMGRKWPRNNYLPGNAEYEYALLRFQHGDLKEAHLAQAERLARAGKSRPCVRSLHSLRGEWQMEQGHWALAADNFSEAVRMAREVGQSAPASEARLALAKFHLGQLPDPSHEAEQLAASRNLDHRALAELWLAIGKSVPAKKYSFEAYKQAWADGEPYVRRYELNKARALLDTLSEDERLNRARRTFDFGALAVHPEEVWDFLLALVHHHDRDLAVGVDEGRGLKRASARRACDSFRAGAYELREVADVVEGVRVDEAARLRVRVERREAEVADVVRPALSSRRTFQSVHAAVPLLKSLIIERP